jgi:UDP-galactopyranose mutase
MNKKCKYDYLLVGAGLFNAIFAREAARIGKKCLVIDKRNHIGGNLYCENVEGINVHKYGPHIFHTNNKQIWDYMNDICAFNHFIYSPIANYKGKLYNLPFNMNTFYQLWKTLTPQQAQHKIAKQIIMFSEKDNLENHALAIVGRDIYTKLIKGYTEKQWGKETKNLPSFIIKRIPLRFTYDNNYFEDVYQGIPIGGYNIIFEKCLENCTILLNTDFLKNRFLEEEAKKIIYTGMIDEYYDYCYGALEYRSLRFETNTLNISNYQGIAVVNYTEKKIPFTRIIEHKHFEYGKQIKTVITKEFPVLWEKNLEPYYPVNTEKNNIVYEQYKKRSLNQSNVFFAGRLGLYKYLNMDQIIEKALLLFNNIEKEE